MSTVTTVIETPIDTKALARACAVLRQSLEQGGVDPNPFIHDEADRAQIVQLLNQSYQLFGNGDNLPEG